MRGLPTKGPDAMDRDFGMTRAEVGSTVVGHNPLFHTVEAWSSDTVRAQQPALFAAVAYLQAVSVCDSPKSARHLSAGNDVGSVRGSLSFVDV
jgi:hypothetical protein